MTSYATYNGDITDTGGENCDYRGFVWDTTSRANPGDTSPTNSAYASNWTESGSYGTGTLSHQVTGLTEDTTYYVRACAHNSAGWDYGGEVSFTTPARTATGTVTLNGTAIENADVYAYNKTTSTFKGITITDVNGDYSIEVGGSGDIVLVAVDFEDGGTRYGDEKSIELG